MLQMAMRPRGHSSAHAHLDRKQEQGQQQDHEHPGRHPAVGSRVWVRLPGHAQGFQGVVYVSASGLRQFWACIPDI